MTKKQLEPKIRIPQFASIEEEATFWDSHDTADYESQFDPVRVRFAKPLSEGITIRLDPQTLTRLRSRASKKGLGPTTLVRMWILDRMRRTTPARGESQARKRTGTARR